MATVARKTKAPPLSWPADWTLADLRAHLGDIPLSRIRLVPPPGTATEKDVLRLDDHEDCLCELWDGVLVEKPVGHYESKLAAIILQALCNFLDEHDLGHAYAPDAPLRFQKRTVFMPDICFVPWDRMPEDGGRNSGVLGAIPTFVVEILSKSNRRGEMERKRKVYFPTGVQVVWEIDPKKRTAKVYRDVERFVDVDIDGVLEGAPALPGFQVDLAQLFDRADRQGPAKGRKR